MYDKKKVTKIPPMKKKLKQNFVASDFDNQIKEFINSPKAAIVGDESSKEIYIDSRQFLRDTSLDINDSL